MLRFFLFCSLLLSFTCLLVAADAAQAPQYIDTSKEHSNYGTDKKEVKDKIKEQVKAMYGKDEHFDENDEMYYFFTLHDYDKDHHLDGHELRQAFADYAMEEDEAQLSLSEITEMTDHVLFEDDTDGDGKISWSEYLASQSYHEA